MMQLPRRSTNIVLGVVVIALLGLGAMKVFFSGRLPNSTEGLTEEVVTAGRLVLNEEQVQELGLKVDTITAKSITLTISRPGEVTADGRGLANVTPGVAGVVRQIHAFGGDTVITGAPLAELESRDLAGVQAEWLNARDRLQLEDISVAREKRLWEQKITSEEEYLAARQFALEAKINARAAEQALRSLGAAQQETHSDELGTYTLRAPITGTVITSSVTLGEIAGIDTPLFVIADLDRVWVQTRLYPKDLGQIAVGDDASIKAATDSAVITGNVVQIEPNISESTRTAMATVAVANKDRRLSPGQYVTVELPLQEARIAMLVPESGLVREPSGEWQVFVETEPRTFQATDVTVSGRGNDGVLVSGIESSVRIVTKGAYFLRGELDKGSLVDDD